MSKIYLDDLQKAPHSYWKSIKNQKNFLDELAIKLKIKKPSDWGKISIRTVYANGGSTLLTYYYEDSLFACLKSVYKNIDWKKEWFPKLVRFPNSYWKSMENRKKFLDNIANQFQIRKPSDWGKLTIKHVHDAGGRTLLNRYNKNSLFTCLQSVYKDVEWRREWFPKIPLFPATHWSFAENCRKFMDEVALQTNIYKPNDWRKITMEIITKKGGRGLLLLHGGSMKSILQSVYPFYDWSELPDDERASTETVSLFSQEN